MRGYTRFTQERDDDAASALAGRFAKAVPEFEGELLQLRGDEALCVFRSARQALRASVELQLRLRTSTARTVCTAPGLVGLQPPVERRWPKAYLPSSPDVT